VARLLVQLKLRLLVNALRSSGSAKISFIISSAFAVLLAIFAFLVLAGFRGKSTSVELTSVIFTVFAFGWLIAPIMIFGVDSTLDPATLALYPLRRLPVSGRWPTSSACSA
jgi:ABC-2 type transport system permease protein